MKKAITALSFIVAALSISSVSAFDYELDDPDYENLLFKHTQWAAYTTPGTPKILICEGVFRYRPSIEPRPVCEETTKPYGAPNYKPARFYQLSDWLEIKGYSLENFVDIDDDDHTLLVSFLKSGGPNVPPDEYEEYYGHKPGYVFSGVGGVETGTVMPRPK